MKITEVAFTGYPVADIVRARAFYEGVLKLEPSRIFENPNGHWIEYDLGSSTFAISNMFKKEWKPSSDGPSVAFEVDDFDSAVRFEPLADRASSDQRSRREYVHRSCKQM